MKLKHLLTFSTSLILLSACQKAGQRIPVNSSNERFILFDADNDYNQGKSVTPNYTSIYRTNLDGTNLTRLTTPPANYYDTEPRVSPDKSKIVFYRFQLGTATNSICMMNIDGTNFRQILTSSMYYDDPSFSPDGTRIAYIKGTVTNGNSFDVYVANIDGSSETRITYITNTPKQTVSEVNWATNGKIYFTTTTGFYSINADGNGLATVNGTPYTVFEAMSADGKYVLSSPDNSNLFLSAADGSNSKMVTNLPVNNNSAVQYATFTGDDSEIYYLTFSGNGTNAASQYAMFKINTDGTGATKILSGVYETPCIY